VSRVPSRLGRDLRRAVDRHRALVAGGLVAAGVATGLSVVAPSPQPVVQVLAAARELPAGAELAAGDVTTVALPVAVVPAGALRSAGDVVGRVLAGPVRSGEALTDVRLLGAGLAPGAGRVAVPVRVAEPALPLLVQAGDRVDVLAARLQPDLAGAAEEPAARAVVTDVGVLAVPSAADTGEGALVVLAATPAAAALLAAAAATSRLTVVVRSR
jgi:pilus assembly protein CpaB